MHAAPCGPTITDVADITSGVVACIGFGRKSGPLERVDYPTFQVDVKTAGVDLPLRALAAVDRDHRANLFDQREAERVIEAMTRDMQLVVSAWPPSLEAIQCEVVPGQRQRHLQGARLDPAPVRRDDGDGGTPAHDHAAEVPALADAAGEFSEAGVGI